MIYDLLDYLFGMLKILFSNVVYVGKLQTSFGSKYSWTFSIRIWKNSKVSIGKSCSIRSGVCIRTYDGNVIIGDRVGINTRSCINALESIRIGNDVIIGQNVCIYDHDHIYESGKITRNNGFKTAPIVIGNNVWIGSNCVILKGVTIGDNCVIGAGTIVRKPIPDNSMVFEKKELVINEI